MLRLSVLALALVAAQAHALKTERIAVTRIQGGPPTWVEVVSERAFVRFSSGTAPAMKAAALRGAGAEELKEYSHLSGWTLVSLPPAVPVASGLAALKALPGVVDAHPDHVYRPVGRITNDPLLNSQYALAQVNASAAWEYEVGTSSRVTIAIVDTGIDRTHPELSAKTAGLDHQFCDPGANKNDGVGVACTTDLVGPAAPACNHGTRVAGVAAASTDNGTQIAGMSWGAQLLSMRVFRVGDCPTSDCSDLGCATDDGAMIESLQKLQGLAGTPQYGRIVANFSLGGTGVCAGTLQAAITASTSAGIVVVAASGNDGGSVNSPGNCNGVITMGATNANNIVTAFSSRGTEMSSHGLVAPGEQVVTTTPGGGTAGATGTSFSSPMGAGLAALVLSAKPQYTPAQVMTAMRAGAEDLGLSSTIQGAGRMNAYRTMRLATNGTLAGFDGEQKPIAFPNPFRLSSGRLVSFAVPPSLTGTSTTIRIYTQDGQFVREIAGLHWDGKNAEGGRVASGTYVFVVSTSRGSGRGRFAVLN